MATGFVGEPAQVVEPVPPPLPPKHDDGDERADVATSLSRDIPLSPVSPASLPSLEEKTRKYSPLADLIESEKAYVDLLTGIIRKVAAAWSRSNLPPRELDIMFRSVEGVYKTNRSFLARLKELGEHPSSPKALGDLLMRWIDELEQPYTTYADRYCTGFDDWEPVKSNLKLPAILHTFSASNPPPSTLPQPARLLDPSIWTLDALFLLPKGRLQYYKKLYSKLLKSTTPGRSDHRLLTGTLGKLDGLLATLDQRANTTAGTPGPHHVLLPHLLINNEANSTTTVVPLEPATNIPTESSALLSGQFSADPASAATSIRGSLSSRDERLSQETALTSVSRESSQVTTSPILDLEKRLATDNTLDIFTMKPKQIRLQIAPPTLLYARELRLSAKVLVRFTPKATGVEVVHRYGHVYILSDLFLVCEEMAQEEQAARSEDGKDMHLCYPPLSGKVLNVMEVPGHENALQISIMRRETLLLEADSQLNRDRIVNEFRECILFAKTILRANQEPVPPVPPISSLPRSTTTDPKTADGSSRERPERAPNPRLLLRSQSGHVQSEQTEDTPSMNRIPVALSPQKSNSLPLTSLSQAYPEYPNVVRFQPETIQDPRCDVASGLESSSDSLRRLPSSHHPGLIGSPRRSSAEGHNNSPPSSFVPGQIVPPPRSASIKVQSPPSTMPDSGLYSSQNPVPQNPTVRQHTSMHSLRPQPQPSMHSLPQIQNPTAPHPQPGLHSSNGQPLPPHSSNPLVVPYSNEQALLELQKSRSSRSLHVQYQYTQSPLPPVPSLSDGLPIPQRPYTHGNDSMGSLNLSTSKPLLPSMQMRSRANSVAGPSILDPSPPTSPAEEPKPLESVRSIITAQTKCKVFQQQQHAQWKSLGSANLTLYNQEPTNVKQLVVEASSKEKSILISTIVLTDGVERVGKTGVAIELSDARGARTGAIYMIQLRNEDSASKVYKALLAGSDRAA